MIERRHKSSENVVLPLSEVAPEAQRLIHSYRDALRQTPEYSGLLTTLFLEASKLDYNDFSYKEGKKGENTIVFHKDDFAYKVTSIGGIGVFESLSMDRVKMGVGRSLYLPINSSLEKVSILVEKDYACVRQPDDTFKYSIGDVTKANITYGYYNNTNVYISHTNTKRVIENADKLLGNLLGDNKA